MKKKAKIVKKNKLKSQQKIQKNNGKNCRKILKKQWQKL